MLPAMRVLTPSNTVYTHSVAKVMISIPDKLLERIDSHVEAAHETRSGFLQRLAAQELEREKAQERKHLEELLDKIGTLDLRGEAAQLIREDRNSH
ncbi:MAG TPA: type II toxin-antitoxin system HicB family antitoxin [Solirubrobacterales bacterium]|nr:type II toxin-antitoxin system HicB family antitoxin [Solirubrobacterales bacterium]